jgi:hypothetical protein
MAEYTPAGRPSAFTLPDGPNAANLITILQAFADDAMSAKGDTVTGNYTITGTVNMSAPQKAGVALVDLSSVETLTNKTLTAPKIATILTNAGAATLTLPTSTDTLVGRATTDTLTNKSISGATNTLSAIPQSAVTSLTTDLAAKIAASIVDAKGDLIAASAADTVVRVAVGANDTILKADSAQASGVKWAYPQPRVLARVTPSAVATFNFGAVITSSYTIHRIVWRAKSGSTAAVLRMRLRVGGADASGSNYYDYSSAPGTYWELGSMGTLQSIGECLLANVAVASETVFDSRFTQASAAGVFATTQTGGQHSLATAYDDITIYSAGGELITGEFILLGYGA